MKKRKLESRRNQLRADIADERTEPAKPSEAQFVLDSIIAALRRANLLNLTLERHVALKDGRRGRIDVLVNYQGRPLVAVEAKKPTVRLRTSHRDQVLGYSRALQIPFCCLTNGTETVWMDGQSGAVLPNGIPMGSALPLAVAEPSEAWFLRLAEQHAGKIKNRLCGTSTSGRKYVPELYEHRLGAEGILGDFLKRADGILGVYGDAGIGKTNLAVNCMENCLRAKIPCFLLMASLVTDGRLRDRITLDFNSASNRADSWENWQSHLLEVFDSSSRPLVFILEGVNETGNRAILRSEVADLFSFFFSRGVNVRWIITCRTESWNTWCRSRQHSEPLESSIVPKGEGGVIPGYRLGPFTYGERNRAWRNYAREFRLRGTLPSHLVTVCQHPVFLRYVCELAATNADQTLLEATLSPFMLIDKYLQYAEDSTQNAMLARSVLESVAITAMTEGSPEVEYSLIVRKLGSLGAEGMLDQLVSESVLLYKKEGRGTVGFYSDLMFEAVVARVLLQGKSSRGPEWLTTLPLSEELEANYFGIAEHCLDRLFVTAPREAEKFLQRLWVKQGIWLNVVADYYVQSPNVLMWARRIASAKRPSLFRKAAEALGKIPRTHANHAKEISSLLRSAARGDFWTESALMLSVQELRQRSTPSRGAIKIGLLTWPAYTLFERAVQSDPLLRTFGIEFVYIENTAEKRDALAQRSVDLILGPIDQAVVLESEGVPTSVLMRLCTSAGTDALVATAEWARQHAWKRFSKRKLTELLRNGAIGIEETGPGHFFIAQLASTYGLSAHEAQKQWRHLPVYNPCLYLLSGALDATSIWDPWQTMLRKEKVTQKLVSSFEVSPRLIVDTLIGRRDGNYDPELILGLRNVWAKTVREIRTNQGSVLNYVSERLAIDRPSAVEMLHGVRFLTNGTDSVAKLAQYNRLLIIWKCCAKIWLYAGITDRLVEGKRACSGILT